MVLKVTELKRRCTHGRLSSQQFKVSSKIRSRNSCFNKRLMKLIIKQDLRSLTGSKNGAKNLIKT